MEDVKRYAGNNIVQLLVGEDSSLAVQMDKQNIWKWTELAEEQGKVIFIFIHGQWHITL